MTTLETLETFILSELRIRLSTFDKVNDPFELLGIRHENKKGRRHFEALFKHWVNTVGFISFTDNWKSPLMWGHYTNNHTGVCLGIEIPEERVLKVDYHKERLDSLLNITPREAAFSEDFKKKVITTKFSDWSYEREWRYVKDLEYKDSNIGLYYEDFSPDFELREIIAGARCPRSLHNIRKQVFANTETIKMFKVRAAFQTFNMVKQQNQEELTISPLHQVNGLNNWVKKQGRSPIISNTQSTGPE